jgi:hypothetical protein
VDKNIVLSLQTTYATRDFGARRIGRLHGTKRPACVASGRRIESPLKSPHPFSTPVWPTRAGGISESTCIKDRSGLQVECRKSTGCVQNNRRNNVYRLRARFYRFTAMSTGVGGEPGRGTPDEGEHGFLRSRTSHSRKSRSATPAKPSGISGVTFLCGCRVQIVIRSTSSSAISSWRRS